MILTKKLNSLEISIIGITAGLYAVLGYLFQPISFLGIQFRIAEIMVGMCIIFPIPGIIGNVIGVFLLNLTSPLGLIDLTSCIVNIPATYCIVYFRNREHLKYLGGVLYAVMISIYVGWILNFVLELPFWLMFVQVLISEVILASLGIYIFSIIDKRTDIGKKVDP